MLPNLPTSLAEGRAGSPPRRARAAASPGGVHSSHTEGTCTPNVEGRGFGGAATKRVCGVRGSGDVISRPSAAWRRSGAPGRVGWGRSLGKSKRIRVGRHLSLEKQKGGWRLPRRVRLRGAPTASGQAPTPRTLLPVSLARHPAFLMKINEPADGWPALSAAAVVFWRTAREGEGDLATAFRDGVALTCATRRRRPVLPAKYWTGKVRVCRQEGEKQGRGGCGPGPRRVVHGARVLPRRFAEGHWTAGPPPTWNAGGAPQAPPRERAAGGACWMRLNPFSGGRRRPTGRVFICIYTMGQNNGLGDTPYPLEKNKNNGCCFLRNSQEQPPLLLRLEACLRSGTSRVGRTRLARDAQTVQ